MDLQKRQQKVDSGSLSLSCIVPVHNEEQNIEAFLQQLKAKIESLSQYFEIMIIDDGSNDATCELIRPFLEDQRIKLINFSRNFGKESAITAGIHACQGDVAIIIDADFQQPLSLIDQFIEKWQQGYDMPYGLRTDRKNDKPLRRWLTNRFYHVLGWLSEVEIPADAGDFRLLDRRVINAIKQCRENSRFMKGLYAWSGFSVVAVPFEVQQRVSGKSSWSVYRLFDLALTGIFSFSDLPLRIWSLIGLAISSVSFLYALWIVFKTLMFGTQVPGYATTVVAIIFFGGVQLISIGILGEYIARIFREVKDRPLYIIRDTVNLDSGSSDL